MPQKYQEIKYREIINCYRVFQAFRVKCSVPVQFIIDITSNVALRRHPWDEVRFLSQMPQSLAGVSSAQCNHRILGADHSVFQIPQPWQKLWISLSCIFHVALRRQLAIWQWLLLNVLHAQVARLHNRSQSTKMSRLC